MKTALYQTEAGQPWTIPATTGVYPVFPAQATDDQKKRITNDFLKREKGIKVAKAVTQLLRKQLLDAIDEEYVMELRHPIFKYERVAVADILNHLFDN